jgi:hypothetical protein
MNTASSCNATVTFISRLAIGSIIGALTVIVLGFGAAPGLRAETPPDQIQAAGAIPLTTELLGKMEKFLKNLDTNDAAKAEIVASGKDPSFTLQSWGSIISATCPKTVGVFKASGLTPDEFAKGIFAIMAVGMSEDLTKSTDKTVQANAVFIEANKIRADAIFSTFMRLDDSGPSSSPASSP